MTILRPSTENELHECLAHALAKRQTLDVRGRGSKTALGRAMQTDHVLDMSAFAGITLYEPEELILQARAGTPVADIEAALVPNRQELAFEPSDLGPLLNGAADLGSVGGLLACNLSGPRRIKAGAARDHFLGVTAYSGRAELFKAGGRVVKNVTGYDLCKLLANSYGTLCVMTDVTLKVLPSAEKTRTVLIYGLDDTGGVAALTKALGSPHEISAAAHLPVDVAARIAVPHVESAAASVTAVRIEGPARSVAHRCAEVRKFFAHTEELHSANSAAFWRAVRDVQPFVGDPRAVWRISVAPQAGPAIGAALRAMDDATLFYDWGGGLIWAAVMPGIGAEEIRAEIDLVGGGHAMLVRGDAAMRSGAVFQPQKPALAALTRRVKDAFDPHRVLNPGRIAPDL
jgi:glycolate oxidase FAD binding subunit